MGVRDLPSWSAVSRVRRPLLITLGVAVALGTVVLVAWGIDLRAHDGQVVRNVTLAGAPVGGFDRDRLQEVVASTARRYDGAEVTIREGSRSFSTTTDALGVSLDPNATIDAALAAGRTGSIPGRVWSWLTSPVADRKARVALAIDQQTLRAAVADGDPGPRVAPVEPSVTFKDGAFVAADGKPGEGIDPGAVVKALSKSDDAVSPIEVTVRRGAIPTRFSRDDARRLAGLAQSTVTRSLRVSAGRTEARAPLSTVRTWVTSKPGADGLVLTLDREAALADLERLLPNAGDPPTDAKFNIVGSEVVVVAGKNGERCCATAAVDLVETAVLAGKEESGELPLRTEPPKLTLAKATGLKIVEPVATFTTKHAAGQSRVANIHRIADILRGTVIQPGDTFSVNTTVGRRTEGKGFGPGGVIEDGVFAEAIGGGISQFATTLFNAAFFAGLEVPEYQAHTIYITRYPYGREATLSYPKPDLKIKNVSPHGVLVWPTYTDTSITVTLYSTKWVTADQTAQTTAPSGNCTRVTTTRTRTWLDGRTDTDKFFALYHPGEGINC